MWVIKQVSQSLVKKHTHATFAGKEFISCVQRCLCSGHLLRVSHHVSVLVPFHCMRHNLQRGLQKKKKKAEHCMGISTVVFGLTLKVYSVPDFGVNILACLTEALHFTDLDL